jgi:hypothetical protein
MQRSHRFLSLLTLVLAVAVIDSFSFAKTAQAGMVLSFEQTDYVANVGDEITMRVFLTQVAGGPQVDAGNPLLSAGIRATYDPSIAFADIFEYNPGFDTVNQSWVAGNWGLTMESLSGFGDFAQPLLLGQYKFIAIAQGVSSVVLSDFDSQAPNFVTLNGDVVDPTNTFTARLTVVPEPASFVMMAFGSVMALAYRKRTRTARRF